MAITLSPSPKFFAPVTHVVLDADGRKQELKFDAQFARPTQDEAESLVGNAEIKARELLDRYMTNWRAVLDDSGAEVPFSAAALGQLCQAYAGMHQSISTAFLRNITNPAEAAHLAAKN